ncbi:DUF1661 domain-containing protein [Porphyromonas gingivalis]|nr:DUF1661 domain-containing protein [Porphyromonas gingivalis]
MHPANCQLFSVHVNSRAKTKKFSRHVFTNADQVIFRTKTQNNSCLFS